MSRKKDTAAEDAAAIAEARALAAAEALAITRTAALAREAALESLADVQPGTVPNAAQVAEAIVCALVAVLHPPAGEVLDPSNRTPKSDPPKA